MKTIFSQKSFRTLMILWMVFFCRQAIAQIKDPSPYCYPRAGKMTTGTCTGSGAYRLRSVEYNDARRANPSFFLLKEDSACYGASDTGAYRRWNTTYLNYNSYYYIGHDYAFRIKSHGGSGIDTVALSCRIDYNLDGDFDDSGELIGFSYGPVSTSGFNSDFKFTIPLGSVSGTTRVRFMVEKYSQGNVLSPCFALHGYGETWDFDVYLGQDTRAPVILNLMYPNPEEYVQLSCDSAFIDTGMAVEDDVDNEPVMVRTGDVDRSRPGKYILSYIAHDRSGNFSYPINRTVIVEGTESVDHQYFRRDFSNGEVKFIAAKLNPAVNAFKWFVDDVYQSGFDNTDTFVCDFKDTFLHHVCIQIAYCNDSVFMACGPSLLGKPYGLSGKVFYDMNVDCKKDSVENGIKGIQVRLYNKNGQFLYSTYTSDKGEYAFNEYYGDFYIVADISGFPIHLSCDSSEDSLLSLSPEQPSITGIDFGVVCDGSDVGVKYIFFRGWIFPGVKHTLNVNVGNLTKYSEVNCPANYGGELKITANGPVKYLRTDSGTMFPASVQGNELTYRINNFDSLLQERFMPIFITDTNALLGDSISVIAEIKTSDSRDPVFNNKKHYSYRVNMSFDPNVKEVYPDKVLPVFNDWLTYTVKFQNTGNAPAMNVRLRDTLDPLLDPETFEVMGSSHEMSTKLNKRALSFYFPDIMLPDSFSDEKNSHGFVQYRIKPTRPLKVDDNIHNTAFIYFDYNEAVVTNTVSTVVAQPIMSVNVPDNQVRSSLYPNPGHGQYVLVVPLNTDLNALRLDVFDIRGILVYTSPIETRTSEIDLKSLDNGLYILKISAWDRLEIMYFLKQ
jgi:uncharacterized repeat protein (TIGR01451 family)